MSCQRPFAEQTFFLPVFYLPGVIGSNQEMTEQGWSGGRGVEYDVRPQQDSAYIIGQLLRPMCQRSPRSGNTPLPSWIICPSRMISVVGFTVNLVAPLKKGDYRACAIAFAICREMFPCLFSTFYLRPFANLQSLLWIHQTVPLILNTTALHNILFQHRFSDVPMCNRLITGNAVFWKRQHKRHAGIYVVDTQWFLEWRVPNVLSLSYSVYLTALHTAVWFVFFVGKQLYSWHIS